MAKATAYYIDNKGIKYGWNSTKDYSLKIGGAKKATGVKGVVYGGRPKPTRVVARLENGKTISFFCASNKLDSLVGQAVAGSKIKSVS